MQKIFHCHKRNIFFLYQNCHLIKKEVGVGHHPKISPSPTSLVKNFSTDHIYPARFCIYYQNIGKYALTGYQPSIIKQSSIKKLAPKVLVAGKNFGCGSARQHAVITLKEIGLKLIFAPSFARIFKENCIHNNILISTDFKLLNRLMKEGKILIKDIIKPYPKIAKRIIERGGLLKIDNGKLPSKSYITNKPLTLSEKIIINKLKTLPEKNLSFFLPVDTRFSYEVFTPLIDMIIKKEHRQHYSIADRESVLLFTDHFVFDGISQAAKLIKQQNKFAQTHNVKVHKNLGNWQGTEGICHSLIMENYALPGDIIVGTDSHTCSAGAVGAFAFGIGATAMARAFIKKDVLFKMPKTTKLTFTGKLAKNCCAKDVVLYLFYLQSKKGLKCRNHILEISGSGLNNWPIDELQTLTNAAAELEAFTAIIQPNKTIKDFIKNSREVKHSLFLKADKNAKYEQTLTINLSQIEPLLAKPGSHRNVQKVKKLSEKVKVQKAFIGSCAGGKFEDVKVATKILRNKKVARNCTLTVQTCSMHVYNQSMQAGFASALKKSGAIFLKPGCGACIGNGPGRIKKGEVGISTSTRNYPGRMGGGNVYLASTATVAATALKGSISYLAITTK